MRIGTLLVIVAALIAGVIAAITARTIIRGRPASANIEQTRIVVAAQPLAFGTALSAENIVEIPWSSSVVPEGAFTSAADLLKEGRRVVLIPMEKNEPVLAPRITGSGQRASLSALIAPGMRAVTLRVDDVRGVAGFVLPGDHVDVVLTRRENNEKAYTDVLLQNAKVLAVDQLANERQEGANVAKAVTVEVSTEQAQKVVLASGVGSLSLVLRQAGGADPSSAQRVSTSDLGQSEAGPDQDKASLLQQKLSALEAELKKRMASPPEAAVEPQSSMVRIIRGVKSEDYSVNHQPQ
jgi:pilus assembly protein CpaB